MGHSKNKKLYALLLTVLLTACGSGGGDGNTPATSAGALQTLILTGISSSGAKADLYAVKEDGSGFAELANSSGSEYFGTISADGRVIYFDANGGQQDIYSVMPDGTGQIALASSSSFESARITSNYVFNQYPTLPDGKFVFERKHATGYETDLYAVNADGSGEIPLATSAADSHMAFAATAGGRVIYRVSKFNADTDLYSILADGSGLVGLGLTADYEEFNALDQTAGRVIFSRTPLVGYRDIYAVNVDGSDFKRLTVSSTASNTFVGLLPDGRVMFYVGSPIDLFSVKPDGTGLVSLAHSADQESFIAVTSDGRVIYSRNVAGVQTDLYIVNSDGSGTVRLAGSADNEFFGGLTRDGKLLYVRVVSGQQDIYTVNLDGTGETRLTDTPEDEEWWLTNSDASDGRLIFLRTLNGQYDVHSIKPDGTGELALMNSADPEELVYITPNGRVIVAEYSTVSGVGQTTLYSIKADGSELKTLRENSGELYLSGAI